MQKTIIEFRDKNGTKCSKNFDKKVAHKAAEPTGQFIGNKIANKIVKPKPLLDKKLVLKNNAPLGHT